MVAINPKEFSTVSWEEALAAVRGGPPISAFYTIPTPNEVHAIYNRGFQGVRLDRVTPERKKSWGSLIAAMPKLYDVFPWAKDFGKGKLSMPWTAILQQDPEWGEDDPQEVGDCTQHGTMHAAGIDFGVDALFGETKYTARLAGEAVYRSRGYNGHGWSCEAPCMYVGPDGAGGLLYRKLYTGPNGEKVDLTSLNTPWESNGRAGVPSWLEEESRKNKVKLVIPITTVEEYRDAIAIGFGINVCSGQGFSSNCDANGLAQASGSWSHSMAHGGCDDRDVARQLYGDMIGLIFQNWGRWNNQDGTKKPPDSPKHPVGCFYAKINVIANRMLGDDSFALCSVYGWDRTNWEAFNVTNYKDELLKHLRDSTTLDKYEARAKMLREHGEKVTAEGFNTTAA